MPDEIPFGDGPLYFFSDVHLGAPGGRNGRVAHLLDLLGEARARAAGLFVLGDLFDFWFEYRHAIPKGAFQVERALASVVESGIPTIYLGGNHDFWAGDYLRRELGLRVYLEPLTLRLQGRLVHLAHGDGLGPGDTGYKILKRILRHPWAIRGYRTIHPDIGIPLATRLSAISRKHTEAREILIPKILRDVARPRLQDDVTAMLMGHVHEPSHFQGEGRDFLILGDWLDNLTHVRMEKGAFTLYRLVEGAGEPHHEAISREPFPSGWRAG